MRRQEDSRYPPDRVKKSDAKAKAAQYFTILNRIEYVIEMDAKYSEPSFLFFWRKFNTLCNMMHRSKDVKDPIEVYFDNQISMVEVVADKPKRKVKKLQMLLRARRQVKGDSLISWRLLLLVMSRRQRLGN